MKILRHNKNQTSLDTGQAPTVNRRDTAKGIVSFLLLIIIAPLAALLLTSFVFQSYEVEGPSMQSTLQNHDRLIVLKVQRTWSRITSHGYVPKRGDIIIFDHPELLAYGANNDRQLIKRVVGLPGERITVKDGILTVYNKANPGGFQPDKTLPYGSAILTTPGDEDIVVPDGQVFVCGDNRVNSLDSRSFGPIPISKIVGKLAMRIYPLNTAEKF